MITNKLVSTDKGLKDEIADIMQWLKERVVADLVDESLGGDYLLNTAICLSCVSLEGVSLNIELRTGSYCPSMLKIKADEASDPCEYRPIVRSYNICDELNSELQQKWVGIDEVWSLLTKKHPLTEVELENNIRHYLACAQKHM